MKLGDVFMLIALSFLAISLIGFILDRPVLVSYVTSNSMKPTLNKGDLFLINPFSKGGQGEIIVFKMNGRWTVHRVYAVTAEGYITKGDNNIATDQQSSGDVVKREDVIGTVVTIFGKPVKVPYVGEYIEEISKSVKNLYIAIIAIVIGAILMTSGKEKRRKNNKKKIIKIKYKTLYAIASTIMLAVFLITIIATWGNVGFSYTSTLAGGQREGWYLPNTEFDKTVTIKNKALYPMYYILNPKMGEISIDNTEFVLMRNEKEDVNVRVKVPSDTKIYYAQIEVYSYPLLLPSDTIKSAWKISPYLPLALLSLEIGSVLAVVYFATGAGDESIVRLKFKKRRYI